MMAFLSRVAHCARPPLARPFITLPDFSSLSPFAGQDGNGNGSVKDTQVYHERKIFPYVSMLYTAYLELEA